MSDFMAHDYGDTVIVLTHRHNPFPEGHLPAGQGKRVNFFTLDDIKFPLELWLVGGSRDPLSDPPELRLPIASGRGAILAQGFLIGVYAELKFLGVGDDDEL